MVFSLVHCSLTFSSNFTSVRCGVLCADQLASCDSSNPPSMASLLYHLSLPKPNLFKATSAPSPPPPTTPISLPDSLHLKFGRKGFKFSEVSGLPVLEMTVRNGSSLTLRIPDAHLTSYKPKVYWKDEGFEEVLYSLPAGGPDSTAVRGGVGLVMHGISDPLPASEWTVKDIESDAIDALQVELGCQRGPLDITYVVTLYSESMATAVLLKNKGVKPVTFSNAILSHLKFKRRNGAGIQGLRECSYCSHPPPSSPFQILSPSQAMEVEEAGWFSFGSEPPQKPGSWKVQDVPFTILDKKMSRVYAAPPSERLKPVYNTPPSKYETLDQGRELFFRVIRMGFEDIYVGSPGSSSQKYGKDHFICTGPASILVPLTVEPGEEWRGAQVIEHDNLT